jgi:uncharacterized protein involved in exopolysaccharide biosynthesis/Mrp family chromosome partitioning ATPase
MSSLMTASRASSQPIEFDWLDIFQLWRRGVPKIMLAAIVGGAAFFALSYEVSPSYDTTAVVLLDRPDASRLATPADTFQSDSVQRATLVRSQLEILSSEQIVRQVVDKLDLVNAPMFNEPPDMLHRLVTEAAQRLAGYLPVPKPEAPATAELRETRVIQKYLGMFTANQDVDTYVLRLQFAAPDPELAARILNTHVAVYLAWLQQQRRAAVDQAYDWLQTAVPNAQARVQAAQAAVDSFRTANKLVDVDGRTSLDQGLAQLSGDLAVAQTTMVRSQARADQIRSLQAHGQIAGIVALSDSKLLADLQTSAADSSAELARLGSTLGANNPDLRAARAHLATIQASIAREIDHLVDGETTTARIAASTVQQLKAALADAKDTKLAAENAGSELEHLQSVAEAEQTVYLSLLTKLRTFDRIGELERSQATLLSPALTPDVPVRPKRALFMLFGLLLGGGMMAATIVWRAARSGTVRHTADVLLSSGIPQIAVMPELALRRKHGGFDRTQPKYAFFLQELRTLYALLRRQGGRAGQGISVVVTSSLPDEGKTSFCGEFAFFAAQSGVRTLLATTDLKEQPSGGAPAGSLVTTQPVQPDRSLPLFRANLPITASLAAQGEAAERIAAWQREYDLVVIDTPPVSGMADSIVLAGSVDSVVVLARIDHTPRALLASVVNQLENAGGRVVGTVVTFARIEQQRGVLPSDFSYYYDDNRAYYRKMLTVKAIETTGAQ